MTDGGDAWCKDCLKIPLNTLFRPASRSRARKFVLPASKDAKLGHPVCPMCRFIRETRRLYDDAYLMSYGHKPEPSVSTGKIQSVLLGGDKHLLWPTILAAEAAPLKTPSETVHAWFKADSASHQESSEPAVLVTFEDAQGATNPLPRQRSKRELEEATIDTAMLSEWMRSTDQATADLPTHPLSPLHQPSAQSLKLINAKTRQVVPADTSFRYVALSYVWGTELPQQDWLTSLSENKSARSRGVLRAHLPETFEDALKLTQDLGECYLWIDLFCIKQDDPRHVQEQIEQMHHIYACATCTIVAYDSHDAFSGLAGVSRPLRLRAQPAVYTPSGGRLMATWIPSADVRRGATLPWNTRAWCFQEKFFSPRLLFLQELETLMVTEQTVQHDIFRPDSTLRFNDWSYSPSLLSLGDQGFLKAYSNLLQDYSGRFLTHPADAINAFGGILSALKHETHQDFRYGTPLGDPHRGLLWSAADEHVLSPREGFPTWSWCGWLGSVRYRDYLFAEQSHQDSSRASELPHTNNGVEHHQSTFERAQLTLPSTETWGPLSHPDHILRIRSSVIACTIRKLPQSREPSALTYISDTLGVARKQDLGYHWTLLGPEHGDDLPDPANNPCWPDLFDASPHWFRFSGAEEAILEDMAASQAQSARSSTSSAGRSKTKTKTLHVSVEIVLIQRWYMVRDASGKVMRDAVGGLVVVVPVVQDQRENNDEASGRQRLRRRSTALHKSASKKQRRRVAAVLMEGRTFDAFDPIHRELDLI